MFILATNHCGPEFLALVTRAAETVPGYYGARWPRVDSERPGPPRRAGRPRWVRGTGGKWCAKGVDDENL